jgi:uncharacterized protein HemX
LPRRKPKEASEEKTKEAKSADPKPKRGSKLAGAKVSGIRGPSAPAKQASGAEKTTEKTSEKATEQAPAEKSPAKKAAAAKKPAAAPAPNMNERMEGLQGWMAEIERKQGRMTYFGAAALLVAILAGGAALYLGIQNQQDSVDKDDFERLEQRVTEIGDSLKQSTEEQLGTLNTQIGTMQQRLDAIESKQKQTDATITTLQQQVNQQATAKPGTGAAGLGTGTGAGTGTGNANP